MAEDQGKTLKVRMNFEKGSQTLNQCKFAAKDSDLHAVAMAVASLRKDEGVEVVKIAETELVG